MTNMISFSSQNALFKLPMKQWILSFCIFACFSSTSQAQNTVITGTVKNALLKEIKLEVNRRFIDNTTEKHLVEIVNDSFRFDIQIDEPQIVTIIYLRNRGEIFVEPYDSVHLDSEADEFQYSFEFSGQGGNNNNCFQQYRAKFFEETNDFRMMQYKKGIVWYKAGRDLDTKMRKLDGEKFTDEMNSIKDEKSEFLTMYETNENKKLSEVFKLFMWQDINYTWAYNTLTYGFAFGNWHRLDMDEFFYFLYDVPWQDDRAMGNQKYRNFVVGVINYLHVKSGSEGNPYVSQYHFAKDTLSGRPQAYVLSQLLINGFKKQQTEYMFEVYEDFLRNNEYPEFNKAVTDAYQLANRYAVGSTAPDFTLRDTSGRLVSLSDFKGKVVFNSYWASWCRPCVAKMQGLNPVVDDLKDSGVVFVYISFDKDVERWKSEIKRKGYKGIHLMAAEGTKSKVAQDYRVRALPEYFIINTNGRFAAKPRKFDINAIQQQLYNLSAKELGQQKVFGTGRH